MLVGIASFGLESCEAIIPTNTTARLGEKAVIKCRLASQNIAWMFCPRNTGPYLIAVNCVVVQSAADSYSLDKTSNACNLVIDNVTASHYGTYTCQDIDLNDHGHSFELGNSNKNLAFNKKAIQSSSLNTVNLANLAVDGSTSSTFADCACTTNVGPIWWAVDLELETSIGRVRITNAITLPQRMSNFFIGLTNVSPWVKAPNVTDSSICKYYTGFPAPGIPVNIYCDPNTAPGRYLFVWLSQPDHLLLCELEAYYI